MAISEKVARQVYDKYGNACALCGRAIDLQKHHIVPRGPGGRSGEARRRSDSVENLVLLCNVCHDARHGIRTIALDGFCCDVCPCVWLCEDNQAKVKVVLGESAAEVYRDQPTHDVDELVERMVELFS